MMHFMKRRIPKDWGLVENLALRGSGVQDASQGGGVEEMIKPPASLAWHFI